MKAFKASGQHLTPEEKIQVILFNELWLLLLDVIVHKEIIVISIYHLSSLSFQRELNRVY